ncbi:MAG: hypothetical protein ACYDBV_13130 [Nitrospiria bacterium]
MKKYFEEQAEFQKNLYDFDKMSYEEKVKLTKDFVLSAHKELSEVLDCLNWKSHRKEDKMFSPSNLGEEIVDVFKYIINIALVWGIKPEEFDKFFVDKSEVVRQRHKQEFLKAVPGEKVCAIDLDDTLNEWMKTWVTYVNTLTGQNYKDDKEIRASINALEFANMKHVWRESGVKNTAKMKKGASALTKYLKKKGYRIIIISSRPYKQYSRMFPDTLLWLRRNHIAFDDLYFEDNKHLKILKQFPKLSFMVENDEKYVQQVAKEGYRVFHLNEECNGLCSLKVKDKDGKNLPDVPPYDKITCVHSLEEIKKYV